MEDTFVRVMTDTDQELRRQLDPEVERLLFPGEGADTCLVTLVYPKPSGELELPARDLASRGKTGPGEQRPGGVEVVRTSFGLDDVENLFELYGLLEQSTDIVDVEVLIAGRELPFVRELWLPLIWSLRG